MSVLSRMGKSAYRAGTSRFGAAAIIAGAGIAGVIGSEPSNESMRGIMNTVIGTPEDGPGADEILLGRKLDTGDVFNPIAPYVPNFLGVRAGPGWTDLKYAMNDGPGVGNPAMWEMQGAMRKRERFMSESADSQFSGMTFDRTMSTFSSRPRSGNLNATGDIVFGAHRNRFK